MFDTLWGQGYAHHIIRKGLFSWDCKVKLFVEMWCCYVCQIATTWMCSSNYDDIHITKICVHDTEKWAMFITCDFWKCLSHCDVSIFSLDCNMKICLTHCEDRDMLITLWEKDYFHEIVTLNYSSKCDLNLSVTLRWHGCARQIVMSYILQKCM